MASDAIFNPNSSQPLEPKAPAKLPQLWFPVLMVVIYWLAFALVKFVEYPIFTRFVTRAGGTAILLLFILIWWLFVYRGLKWYERLLTVAVSASACALTKLLCGENLRTFELLLSGAPIVLTGLVLAQYAARIATAHTRLLTTLLAVSLAWAPYMGLRAEGLQGSAGVEWHWRWTATAEDLFLAEHAKNNATPAQPVASISPSVAAGSFELPNDWTGFRGPNRDGSVRATRISTDWTAHPPKALWRQLAGPSWSSMIVIGDHLITQEQRGDIEVVVCLDAATGKEMWAHADKVRHWDGESGAGPRGTPAYAKGRVVSVGGDGTLNCLDIVRGGVLWLHDLKADSGGKTPMWGFSSSPLILGNLVVIYAGAEGKGEKKNLLAYDLNSGEKKWSVSDGEMAYTSPQPAVLNGVPQVLSFTNRGLTSVEPETGKTLWNFEENAQRMWRAIQPHPLDGNSVLISSEADFGTIRLDIAKTADGWTATERWRSKNFKPSYNDYAVHDGYIYGFHGGIFSCVDAKTGALKWKGGMYDHGQMLLLADQALILVLTERGEVVLLSATPEKHTELGTFDAIEGKTWNHMAFARGRLYVRNAKEIACYQLPEEKAPETAK